MGGHGADAIRDFASAVFGGALVDPSAEASWVTQRSGGTTADQTRDAACVVVSGWV